MLCYEQDGKIEGQWQCLYAAARLELTSAFVGWKEWSALLAFGDMCWVLYLSLIVGKRNKNAVHLC